ncbi:glycosyltransferase [Polynucleobacter paneuropaeus]|uniref:glycosyltransferase family 2 protein n=1 Tax=Polynucleobacter paneuropaeus TaxID=2527775 RepID=UPI000DBF37B9|nr:glycosyltransferase family 2 protein [Polynucleobacter paneuropaeus]AWW47467.1 glycosyltransferase [Polynucleobacter paneuropaeus]
MRTPPLVSIITCVINDIKSLEVTIQKMAIESYANLEFIIVDGGSNDGTKELLNQSEAVVTRWVSECDQGIYDAWNKGLKLAKGQYIAFLGAGDYYLPGGLQDLVELALSDPEAEFIFGRVAIKGYRKKVRIIGMPWSWDIFRHYMCTTHVGALHSRKLFDRYGPFDSTYRIAGDYELLLRAGVNLRNLFSNNIVAIMQSGGISQKNERVLIEAMRAKVEHQVVSKITANWDFLVAYLKLLIRNNFLN